VTEAEQTTTGLFNVAMHSQLVVAAVVPQVKDMAESEEGGTREGTIGDFDAEDNGQDHNIQSERYQKVGAPTIAHIDEIVLAVSSISGGTYDTNNIFKDLSGTHMLKLSDNDERVYQSPLPAVNINIAELQRRVEELTAKLESAQIQGVSNSQLRSGSIGVSHEQSTSTELPRGRRRGRTHNRNNCHRSYHGNSTRTAKDEKSERQQSRSVDGVMETAQPVPARTGQTADQRGDAPRYQFNGQQQAWYESLNYNRFNNRGAPRRGLQPNFYRWLRGAQGGYHNFKGGYRNLTEGCYQCNNFRKCQPEMCKATFSFC